MSKVNFLTEKELVEKASVFFEKNNDSNSILMTEDGVIFMPSNSNYASGHASSIRSRVLTISRKDVDKPSKEDDKPTKGDLIDKAIELETVFTKSKLKAMSVDKLQMLVNILEKDLVDVDELKKDELILLAIENGSKLSQTKLKDMTVEEIKSHIEKISNNE